MKPNISKFGLYLILLFSLLTLVCTPFYMYFSHDVDLLKTQYPHIIRGQKSDPGF